MSIAHFTFTFLNFECKICFTYPKFALVSLTTAGLGHNKQPNYPGTREILIKSIGND